MWPEAEEGMEILTPPSACSYLPSQIASLQVRLRSQLSGEAYEQWLQRGWRRHGIQFFRPACPECACCRSLRVPLARFRRSKSQRRIWQKNRDVRVEIGAPLVDSAHLRLFDAYHRDMQQRRGWPFAAIDAEAYVNAFLSGVFEFALEFRYFRKNTLVGVGLVDQTPQALSSVYFYHAPAWRPDGPGTFSLLREMQFAAQQGLQHHYLGYWIADCPSMAYKARFRPHEILQQYVTHTEAPCWIEVSAPKPRMTMLPDKPEALTPWFSARRQRLSLHWHATVRFLPSGAEYLEECLTVSGTASVYEKLGIFYLGRTFDRQQLRDLPVPLLYDSRDLLTHAVIVGMTGSGKTGLGIGLLEEAAIDNIPALIIDPKGDMGNLLLTFPELRAADFSPWVQADDARSSRDERRRVCRSPGRAMASWAAGVGSGRWSNRKAPRIGGVFDLHARKCMPVNRFRSSHPSPSLPKRCWKTRISCAIVSQPPRPVSWGCWDSQPIRCGPANTSF